MRLKNYFIASASIGMIVFMPAVHRPASAAGGWVQIGKNATGIATAWIRPSSYKSLNSDSFRVEAQYTNDDGRKITGKFDVNCRNRDYYFRPIGIVAAGRNWNVIEKGSPAEAAGQLLCRKTSAADQWGFTKETKALWGGPVPPFAPDMAEGEWVKFVEKPELEAFYNDSVIKDSENNTITFSYYFRTNKGDMSVENQDMAKYAWIRASCKRNIGSTYIELEPKGNGIWSLPTPGAPDGAVMAARKKFCD